MRALDLRVLRRDLRQLSPRAGECAQERTRLSSGIASLSHVAFCRRRRMADMRGNCDLTHGCPTHRGHIGRLYHEPKKQKARVSHDLFFGLLNCHVRRGEGRGHAELRELRGPCLASTPAAHSRNRVSAGDRRSTLAVATLPVRRSVPRGSLSRMAPKSEHSFEGASAAAERCRSCRVGTRLRRGVRLVRVVGVACLERVWHLLSRRPLRLRRLPAAFQLCFVCARRWLEARRHNAPGMYVKIPFQTILQ